jgi:hypothetical protein
MSKPRDDELFRVGDLVRHKKTGLIGKVARFAHDGTTDFWADNDTGPYKQADFEPLSRARESKDEPVPRDVFDLACDAERRLGRELERLAIVMWLRTSATRHADWFDAIRTLLLADAIERGRHLENLAQDALGPSAFPAIVEQWKRDCIEVRSAGAAPGLRTAACGRVIPDGEPFFHHDCGFDERTRDAGYVCQRCLDAVLGPKKESTT